MKSILATANLSEIGSSDLNREDAKNAKNFLLSLRVLSVFAVRKGTKNMNNLLNIKTPAQEQAQAQAAPALQAQLAGAVAMAAASAANGTGPPLSAEPAALVAAVWRQQRQRPPLA